ncbi:DUF131 domain-containing protein [Ferroplasma sp.]|uniref:TIGR00304 family membrane protein n=1 Tax=Ferroplasma sp. TaxID=2591003 RepID=UPI002623BB21|nr:DUF131 domain-containing protein [Ferroplasma sp.]MCL4452514.1 DUF131 domain-containing protein [Candidatus Thermoplasmatota archaeon]
MNGRLAGIFLILAGFIILILLALEGLVQFGIFLFIPFAVSTSPLAVIPFIMIFSGIVIFFISVPVIDKGNMADRWQNEGDDDRNGKKSQTGGLVMIGPVPIIFGNDRKLIYISMAVAAGIIILYILSAFNLL